MRDFSIVVGCKLQDIMYFSLSEWIEDKTLFHKPIIIMISGMSVIYSKQLRYALGLIKDLFTKI